MTQAFLDISQLQMALYGDRIPTCSENAFGPAPLSKREWFLLASQTTP